MNLIQGFEMGNGKSDLLFHYSEGLIIGLITNSLLVSDWMLWLKDILSSSIFFSSVYQHVLVREILQEH